MVENDIVHSLTHAYTCIIGNRVTMTIRTKGELGQEARKYNKSSIARRKKVVSLMKNLGIDDNCIFQLIQPKC